MKKLSAALKGILTFYKNFEDMMDDIHMWRSGNAALFCGKKLRGFFTKYSWLEINRFKNKERRKFENEQKFIESSCRKKIERIKGTEFFTCDFNEEKSKKLI